MTTRRLHKLPRPKAGEALWLKATRDEVRGETRSYFSRTGQRWYLYHVGPLTDTLVFHVT